VRHAQSPHQCRCTIPGHIRRSLLWRDHPTIFGNTTLFFAFTLCFIQPAWPQNLETQIESDLGPIEAKVIKWRRDIHQHPELGNREARTAALVAKHLRDLGMEVQTEVAHTGVVGTLRGGKPGPTIALRADMDALPVTEQTDVPFASTVRTTYNGEEVGVMHACGHDTHTAMLMGAAEVLAKNKKNLAGTVKESRQNKILEWILSLTPRFSILCVCRIQM